MLSKLDRYIKSKGHIIIRKEEGTKNTYLEITGPKSIVLILLTSIIHHALEQKVLTKADLLDVITLALNKKGK